MSSVAVPAVDFAALPARRPSPQDIRRQVEAALAQRVPAALTLRERPAAVVIPTGIAAVDALCGGVPRGALTEFTGPACSGRTALLLGVMAEVTRAGECCALIDAAGSFDPASAERAGVELARVLWVRCGLPNCRTAELPNFKFRNSALRQFGNPKQLSALERSLRVADLLLSGGGFGLVALDLAGVPAEEARRVPLTTWFRFRRAVEGTPAALVVVEQEAHAKSCAEVVLRLRSSAVQRSAVSAQLSAEPSHAGIFETVAVEAELVRGQAQKKRAAGVRPVIVRLAVNQF